MLRGALPHAWGPASAWVEIGDTAIVSGKEPSVRHLGSGSLSAAVFCDESLVKNDL